MKRLGKYTGKIYNDDEAKDMKECGTCITDEQANDENFIIEHHKNDLVICGRCFFGCPASKIDL